MLIVFYSVDEAEEARRKMIDVELPVELQKSKNGAVAMQKDQGHKQEPKQKATNTILGGRRQRDASGPAAQDDHSTANIWDDIRARGPIEAGW